MSEPTGPRPAAPNQAPEVLLLSALLRHTAVDGAGHSLGRLADVIVRLRQDDYPEVTVTLDITKDPEQGVAIVRDAARLTEFLARCFTLSEPG